MKQWTQPPTQGGLSGRVEEGSGQRYEMSDGKRGLCCYFGEVDRPEWTRDAGSGEEFKRHGRGRKGAPDREVKVEKVGISRHSIFGISYFGETSEAIAR